MRLKSKGTQVEHALTLMELLVVMIILGILAAAVTPHFYHMRMQGDIDATKLLLASINRTMSDYTEILGHGITQDIIGNSDLNANLSTHLPNSLDWEFEAHTDGSAHAVLQKGYELRVTLDGSGYSCTGSDCDKFKF